MLWIFLNSKDSILEKRWLHNKEGELDFYFFPTGDASWQWWNVFKSMRAKDLEPWILDPFNHGLKKVILKHEKDLENTLDALFSWKIKWLEDMV